MNSSQYMHYHADYLHPLPTTLDVKKSPLALLAQTCSSIGKDVPPPKANGVPQDRKDAEKGEKPISLEKKVHTSPSVKKEHPKEGDKPGFRTVPPKDIPPLVPIPNDTCDSPTRDQKMREPSPIVHSRPVSTGSKSSPVTTPTWSQSREKEIHDHHSRIATSTPIHSKSATLPPSYSQASMSYGSIKPSNHPLYSGLHASSPLGYPGLSLHGISPEAAAVYQSQLLAHSGLHVQGLSAASAAAAAAQQSALKASAAAAASMNPYVSYTRVRTPSGATTLVPVCKDPYCTNCQLTVQTSHTSATCTTPGCSQCAHEKALLGLAAGSQGMGLPGNHLSFYPQLSSLPSSAAGLSPLHSLYAHPHSALSAHQGLPYVCNWVSGHDYCGKRFNSSEELMQHLRSHTSSIESGLPAGYGLGLSSALSAASASLAHLGGSAPISPNALRRAYPTSLSPGLMASRYHPYKSPLGSVAAPPSAQQFPPLSAYYPPYSSLYGPRLGAAVP
ncbi:hypothetical protein SNE40_019623 [Patella caerulea]|uniref:C2H2-type domain-containing protein n=1 Tax=Patella caerulea TaxID=87958 RepID=A0AAN8PG22_PATCE